MTFFADPPTLRVMMNGFDLMVRPTIDVQPTDKNRDQDNASYDTESGVCKCKWELWNMLMSSNRYIRMSLVLQEIYYGI